MSFTDEQENWLSANLSTGVVKKREIAGRKVDYIEAWHAIAEANRIFGYGCWDRETIYLNETCEVQRKIGKGQFQKDGWEVGYLAKVRITVRDKEGNPLAVREGTGAGTGIGQSRAEAHESAAKEAESDSMKRALMTFGNPFGLALYDKAKAHVGDEEQEAAPAVQALPKNKAARDLYAELQQDIDSADSVRALETWVNFRKPDIDSLPDDWRQELRSRYADKKVGLIRGPVINNQEESEYVQQ